MTLSLEAASIDEEPGSAIGARPSRRLSLPWISVATVGVLIGLWSLVSYYRLVPPLFLPSPLAVSRALSGLATTGFVDATLAQHVAASLSRIFGALGVALMLGVPAGLAIGTSRWGKGILDPIVEFLRPLPPLAYLPLVIIWLGIGEASKIAVIALAMLPPIILSTASGVKSASSDHINAARAFGASRRQLLQYVILPGALPSILTGTRIALGAGWSTLVAAELVAATRGLGFMIQSAAQFLVTDIVIAGIVVIAVVAFLFEVIARWIERRLVPWSSRR